MADDLALGQAACVGVNVFRPPTNNENLQDIMIKRILLLSFALFSLVMGVTACHTAHGAGEDISNAGNKIQEHTPP